MHIAMAGEAVGKFAEHLLAMRGTVAVGASRQMSMLDMAVTAANLTMTAASRRPEVENLCVAGRTGGKTFIASRIDQQWLMDRMALSTGAFLLLWQVRLMTLGTGGALPMLLAVTIDTSDLAMSTRLLAQGAIHLLMALSTEIPQHLRRREQERCVGILVTVQAHVDIVTVRKRRMALATVGHQFIVVVPAGVVGMEGLMAILTGEAMRAPGLAQVAKVAHMAATTFRYGHRSRQLGVGIGTLPCGLLLTALVAGGNHGAGTQKQSQRNPRPEMSQLK
jgi:hypothetical protein